MSGLNGVLGESRARLLAVLAHNQNEASAQARAVAARQQGLDPGQFATVYPGTKQTATTTFNGVGALKGALLGAAIAAGCLVGGGSLVSMLMPRPAVTQPTPVVQPTRPVATSAAPLEMNRVTKRYTANGVAVLSTVRVREMPDGTWQKQVNGEWIADDGK